MRLIDADELIKSIDYSADLGGALGKVVEVVKNYAKFMVQTAPTIKEQKTGKWINCKYPLGECSECNAIVDIQNNEANYCPVCGSRNRGEEE